MSEAIAAAAARHAANKRVIKPWVERLLEASGPVNAGWLAWYRALRICAHGKKDDLADALAQGYYHTRDALRAAHAKAAKEKGKGKGRTDAPDAREPPTSMLVSSVDLGFKNLAYCVLRVYVDGAVDGHALLDGVNFEVRRWERVDCLALAGMSGLDVNRTNMHRLNEIFMHGVALHADSMFGTLGGDERLDALLLENQPMGGFAGNANPKTFAASHVLQACCMLHYVARGLPRCPPIEFVSAARKTADAALPLPVPETEAGAGGAEAAEPARPRKRAKKHEADALKPVTVGVEGTEGTEAMGAVGAAASGEEAEPPVRAVAAPDLWRAPFRVGTEGLVWRVGEHPDPKRAAAQVKRAAAKRKRGAGMTVDDGVFA